MKKIFLTIFLTFGILKADSIGLNVNNEDFEILGTLNVNSTIGYGNGIDYEISGSYLNTENDDLFKAGFSASSPLAGAEGLTLTFGIEGVYMEDYIAMPLFGQAALKLPLDEPIPVTSLIARVDYAPSVLSFIDADTYLEYRFEADMEVISNIHIFGGYRNIDTDYETRSYNLNDSWYGGLKISF